MRSDMGCGRPQRTHRFRYNRFFVCGVMQLSILRVVESIILHVPEIRHIFQPLEVPRL